MATTRRPTAADALRLGRRRFLAAQRVDVSAIAEELGVNRVTLYRWFGSRDQFLVEIVWSLARGVLDDLEAADLVGRERVVTVAVGLIEQAIDQPGMRRWLGEDGEHSMRLLTRGEAGFQPRLIAAIQAVLTDEDAAGRLDLPLPLDELAYVVVRLIESYTYLDLITGERPDARRAEGVLRMLLRPDAT